jgi:hypothetical protein
VSFFREVCGLTLPQAIAAKAAAYEMAMSSGCWWLPCCGFAILSARPAEIHRDDRGRLHCETGMAITWPDGWGFTAWHGTRIPADWITNRASLDPRTALTWPNVEQRRAAAEIIGWKRILGTLDARAVDVDDPEIGTLLEVDLPDSPKSKFLRVMCGTRREFVLPVPGEMRTALEANSWTYDVPQIDIKTLEART